jgi:hypothetical protein
MMKIRRTDNYEITLDLTAGPFGTFTYERLSDGKKIHSQPPNPCATKYNANNYTAWPEQKIDGFFDDMFDINERLNSDVA